MQMNIPINILVFLLLIIFAKGLLLSLIAILLELLLFPLNLISVIIKYAKKRGFWKVFNEFQFNDAKDRDIFLHRNYRTFWNITSSKGETKFGRKEMTLSSMMGLKFKEKSLTGLLWFFYYFLYLIDFKQWNNQGHCINAYNNYLKQKK